MELLCIFYLVYLVLWHLSFSVNDTTTIHVVLPHIIFRLPFWERVYCGLDGLVLMQDQLIQPSKINDKE